VYRVAPPDDPKLAILSRRARFVAAALVGLGCNETPPATTAQVTIAPPPAGASATPQEVPEPVASAAPPEPPQDRDGDGIPDDLDACPDVPGTASPDPRRTGCPLVCLSIVFAPAPAPFAQGSDLLSPAAIAALDEWAESLRTHPQWNADLEGHCDGTEPASLAARRAAAAQRYLVTRGIHVARLHPTSAGSSQPLAWSTNPAGREKNRRVELHLR